MAFTGQLTGSVVGRDPEVKYFENGNIVANFTVSARQFKRKGEEQVPRYVRVAIWGKSAEYVGNYLKRGDSVLVTGRIGRPEIYQSNTGETKVNENFSADNVEKFMPREDSQPAVAPADTGACPMPGAPPAAPPLTVGQQNVANFNRAQAAQQQQQTQAVPQSGEIPF